MKTKRVKTSTLTPTWGKKRTAQKSGQLYVFGAFKNSSILWSDTILFSIGFFRLTWGAMPQTKAHIIIYNTNTHGSINQQS